MNISRSKGELPLEKSKTSGKQNKNLKKKVRMEKATKRKNLKTSLPESKGQIKVCDMLTSSQKKTKRKRKDLKNEELKNRTLLHFYKPKNSKPSQNRELPKVTPDLKPQSKLSNPPRRRKKRPLFESDKQQGLIKSHFEKPPSGTSLAQPKRRKQTKPKGRNFNALYIGPPDKCPRRTTDDLQSKMLLHEQELEQLDREEKLRQLPKYYITSDSIESCFQNVENLLTDIYCCGLDSDKKEAISKFVHSELLRIAIIFFDRHKDLKVDFSKLSETKQNEDCEDRQLSGRLKSAYDRERKATESVKTSQNALLLEKYAERCIKDLICNSKNSLKSYLYNYLHSLNTQDYLAEIANKDDEWASFLAGNTDGPQAIRTSSRLKTKKVQHIHTINKQYSAVFFGSEGIRKNQAEEVAAGNSAVQVIKTCCEDLGFKVSFVNGLGVKRNSANLVKYIKEKTQSSRILFQPSEEEERNSRTAIVFQDVDNPFPDEIGFSSGVLKCIEHSKIPIFITSNKKFDDCEIVKRCTKKGLKIKNVKMFRNCESATKITIRFHLITLFECFIKDSLQKYLDKHGTVRGDQDILFNPDCLKVEQIEALSQESLKQQKKYIEKLLKFYQFNMEKALTLVSLQNFESICKTIDDKEASIIKYSERKDLFWNDILFSDSRPGPQLCQQYFENTLDQIIESTQMEVKPLDTSEEDFTTDKKKDDDISHLQNYSNFLQDQAHLDFFHGRQEDKEEDISTRNVCDVNFTKLRAEPNLKDGFLLEEFLLGIPKGRTQKGQNQRRKKPRRSSNTYSDFIKATPTLNGSRMTIDRLGENNEQIPYFCYPSKEGALIRYKKCLSSTESLYGTLASTEAISKLSCKLNLKSFLK
ncbi:unnamed protein product [Moneuplotes crassus]|uniref:Uncharacterized protein n=1 Tax=Euplotes crassus TaxID=5936 RepID=A0AAD1Y455_EUPCR|nr:unnamed protein product [Moneuplotes crassus]